MTQPAGLASLNSSTGTVLYGRGQLGSVRLKTSQLPAISILAVLILCLARLAWVRFGLVGRPKPRISPFLRGAGS